MPTILIDGYKFRFYSSDVNEPPHMHVIGAEREAKIWLDTLEVAHDHGYGGAELNRVLRLTRLNEARLKRAWNEYFGQI